MLNNRNFAIDNIRALAAISVCLYHYTYRINDLYDLNLSIDIFKFGYLGVELFFILSGYLMLGSITKYSPVQFFKKRFNRIYPTFFVSVIFTSIITLIFSKHSRVDLSLIQLISNLTFLNIPLKIDSIDGVYWTLFIEVLFYFLLFALAFFQKVTKIKDKIVELIIFISLIGSGFWLLNPGYLSKIFLIFGYLYLFIIGILIKTKKYPFYIRLISVAIFLLCYSLYSNVLIEELFIIIASILAIILIDLNILNIKNSWLSNFGRISYPFYLIHQNIGYFIILLLPMEEFITIPIAILLITLISYILNRYVEERFS